MCPPYGDRPNGVWLRDLSSEGEVGEGGGRRDGDSRVVVEVSVFALAVLAVVLVSVCGVATWLGAAMYVYWRVQRRDDFNASLPPGLSLGPYQSPFPWH